MTTSLVWAFPNFNQVFIIECDISRSRIVAVLRQKQLIASHSHTLHGKKLLLSTYEKEMLALIMAVQKWRHYLLGRRRFIMRMNHRSLIKMDPNWFPERWLYKLIGFDFTI
uniref:Reverse transcriptase RNase H-like domain-containing protein n=1 Tax=Quercus lobata TaxID=97700 RepID=A0A7N2MNT8_QUELO